MDNDTYDDRHAQQTKVNKNLISRIQELEDVVKQQSKLIDRTTTLIDNMAESMLNHLMAERSAESNKDKEYSYIEDGLPPF
jgi:hypothetical protein|tara:strand:- start:108 stop:350 length:243 start_codon:yes stop_codon:yes gene_type:complete